LAFLRVVEVFPPLLQAPPTAGGDQQLEGLVDPFLADIKAIRGLADVILVASLKKPDVRALSTVGTALILRKRLRLDAAPVMVVRDQDRVQLLASVVTGLVGGLKSMMLAWGDADEPRKASRILGFASLTDALKEACQVRDRARSRCRFFAPVDLRRLFRAGGVSLAKGRLTAGAELLLAQPPTTDAAGTFDSHARLIKKAGLEGSVLPNVFPFKSPEDLKECEMYFGWRLSKEVHDAAKGGAPLLLDIQREVVHRLRSEHFPGVYLSTRGDPAIAKQILS
jgi:hypothetical protein